MSIGHTLLGLLESGPRHSCDLKRAFDEKFGHGRPPEPYFRSTIHRGAADVLDTRCAEHLRSVRARTERKRGGEPADQLIRDRALFHRGADLCRLELTEARRDRLREEVAR
ncbi:hypothetical protein [Streptomyces sp. NPDC055681]